MKYFKHWKLALQEHIFCKMAIVVNLQEGKRASNALGSQKLSQDIPTELG
jgi:hypothetical protein